MPHLASADAEDHFDYRSDLVNHPRFKHLGKDRQNDVLRHCAGVMFFIALVSRLNLLSAWFPCPALPCYVVHYGQQNVENASSLERANVCMPIHIIKSHSAKAPTPPLGDRPPICNIHSDAKRFAFLQRRFAAQHHNGRSIEKLLAYSLPFNEAKSA